MRRPLVHGAMCARHPEVSAVDVCGRCGGFVCPDCVEYVDGSTPSCGPCARLRDAERPSRRGWAGVVLSLLGALGMVLGFGLNGRTGLFSWALSMPLGFVGLGVSLKELSLLKSRSASSAALRVARLGRALGLLHALLAAVVLGLFGFFLWAWQRGD